VVRRRGEGIASTVALVGGYLLAWSMAGLVPLAALVVFRSLSDSAGDSRWLPLVAGLALVIGGAYQFTRWKTVCLRTCRSPFAFLMEHDFGGGSRAAVRAGIVQGGYCLGCCWALMSVLLVVGLMNLVWMIALTLVFLAEKCLRHGWVLPRVVGTALVAIGVAVAVDPSLLQIISGVAEVDMTGM
jgi:predicted metal-binding membrane protein